MLTPIASPVPVRRLEPSSGNQSLSRPPLAPRAQRPGTAAAECRFPQQAARRRPCLASLRYGLVGHRYPDGPDRHEAITACVDRLEVGVEDQELHTALERPGPVLRVNELEGRAAELPKREESEGL